MIRRSDMPLTRAGSHPRGLTLYGITTLLRSKEIACPEWGRRSCLGLERLRRRRAQRFAAPGVKRVVDHQAMTQHYAWCRSEEHTSELQSHSDLVCRLLLEKKHSTHLGPRRESA